MQLLSEGRVAVQAKLPLLCPTSLSATPICGRASYRSRCGSHPGSRGNPRSHPVPS